MNRIIDKSKKILKRTLGINSAHLQQQKYQYLQASRSAPKNFPVEFDKSDKQVLSQVVEQKLSMCGDLNLFTTLLACKHVVNKGIDGDFVECGVWRGGNGILAAHEFAKSDNQKRKIFLLDTFAGMNKPTDIDTDISTGKPAISKYLDSITQSGESDWCFASLEEVRGNFNSFDLLRPNVQFIQGEVEKVLQSPDKHGLSEKIAVLRLDTDWYESTKAELQVLWPRLSPGGILIIDDYGSWSGCKKAVDEFFEQKNVYMQPIDNGARILVKSISF